MVKRVTLIASFRSNQAIAVCGDSQETVTCFDEYGEPYELRKTVQKLSPQTLGPYQLIIAGAGNARLIESFIVRASRARITGVVGLESLRNGLEQILTSFYEQDVRLCPDDDKNMRLFIGASIPMTSEYALWVSENIALRDAACPELNGWAHELYTETAIRLATPRMSTPQAALASIYTLTIARKTSNYIGGDLQLAVVGPHGISLEDADYVKTMEERLRSYDNSVNRLFLSCADTTLSVPDLEDSILEFKSTALQLHRDHIDQQAAMTTMQDFSVGGRAMRRLPPGPIGFGPRGFTVEHDRKVIEDALADFRSLAALSEKLQEELKGKKGKSYAIGFSRCQKCGKRFAVQVERGEETADVTCFHCGETQLPLWENR